MTLPLGNTILGSEKFVFANLILKGVLYQYHTYLKLTLKYKSYFQGQADIIGHSKIII